MSEVVDFSKGDFNENDCIDALSDIQAKYKRLDKPSELLQYYNEVAALFRGVYNVGVDNGFLIFEKATEKVKEINGSA
ncbi:hypothetical protein OD91_0880 [Lutibacter sp. Hel_I_33_5]|uniref:hypothetical protein n=1 Tax=Lutibacter sp. Hel_I_33_5 TaxID=1566289 RepID=UPI0011A53FFA|nr:hypothetical protein [Lutibacter sp. Hel_I_33_5]TVZ55625.1 hypothetical protein OD91_0880 [Lutibacter sp. Hel_I_33_5]